MAENEDGKADVNKVQAEDRTGFDFDLWERLARLDPVEFERQRIRYIGTLGSSRGDVEELCKRIESMRDRNAVPMENLQWLMSWSTTSRN